MLLTERWRKTARRLPEMRRGLLSMAFGALWALPVEVADAQAVPRDTSWTIESGTYAGIRVPIDSALSRGGQRGSRHFLRAVGSLARVSRLRGNEGGEGRVVGWNPSRLPIAVGFRHGPGDLIASNDSTAFWEVLRQMEADLGMHLFVPATVAPNDDPSDAIIVAIRNTAGADGMTLITWTSAGDVYDARVFLRDRSSLHSVRVVTHEMMHALGFGHTDRWASVMNPSYDRIGRLTAEDVAYAQVAYKSRISAEASDIWQRLTLAIEREPDNTRSDFWQSVGPALVLFPEPCVERGEVRNHRLPVQLLTGCLF